MNNTYLCFPYKFQKDFPLISPKELTFPEFVKISNFTNSDYHFDEKNLSLTQQAYRVDLRFAKAGHTLTGVKLLAYHLMCLNTAHIYTKEYILAVANLFGITEENVDGSQKHFTKLYISYHLILIEEILDAKYPRFAKEFTLTQSKEIVCNSRRKLWNLFETFSFYPADFSEACKNLMNLCDTNALREYPLLPELVAEENNREMYGFIQNIRKKSSRLVTDYCKYYMSKLENYPEALEVTLKKGVASQFPAEWLTTYITKKTRS